MSTILIEYEFPLYETFPDFKKVDKQPNGWFLYTFGVDDASASQSIKVKDKTTTVNIKD